jgi:signal transduction histidine kinase
VFGLVGLIQDMTERRKREEERIALERLMQRAQNLESLGAMASSIAHEFNNLLQRVLGHAELALLDVSHSHPAREAVQMIHEAGTTAAHLTKQMLTLSGRSRFAVESLNLTDLVLETVRDLQPQLGATTLDLPSRSPAVLVLADRPLIQQVVLSLIHNAADAMDERPGAIVIRVGSVEFESHVLDSSYSVRHLDGGKYGYVEVRDSGAGIPPETLERIYDPFFSTHILRHGLGLAAVRGIVHGHRGALQVCSEVGVGTSFRILLPAVIG